MNKNEDKSNLSAAIGETIKDIATFMAILFCALRACGVIQWKWYWLMAPIFGKWVLSILLLALGGLLFSAEMRKKNGESK